MNTPPCMKEFMWKSQSVNPCRLALYMKVRTHLQRWLFAVEKYNNLHSVQLQRNMLATFNSMLVSSLEPLTSTFTDRQQEIVNESGYTDLTRNCNQIINCAMLLSLGYIHEATTYAESCGGGGSPGSGWGRDKDEDDDHWWRRCIAVSAAMMRPAKYRLRRGR